MGANVDPVLDHVLDDLFDDVTERLMPAEVERLVEDTPSPTLNVMAMRSLAARERLLQLRMARLFRSTAPFDGDETTAPVAFAWLRAQVW